MDAEGLAAPDRCVLPDATDRLVVQRTAGPRLPRHLLPDPPRPSVGAVVVVRPAPEARPAAQGPLLVRGDVLMGDAHQPSPGDRWPARRPFVMTKEEVAQWRREGEEMARRIVEMTSSDVHRVKSDQIRVGTVMLHLGVAHEIVRVEDSSLDEVWRTAYDADGWCVALVPGQSWWVQ